MNAVGDHVIRVLHAEAVIDVLAAFASARIIRVRFIDVFQV